MKCADRFGKLNIDVQFQSTQMIVMLALSADEIEQFIEAKPAAGTPVEDVTVKKSARELSNG